MDDGLLDSKEEMILTIDAKNLEEGEYFAEVQLSSNDPVNSFSVVDVHLTVKENEPPVAKNISVKGVEDNIVNFELVASDPNGDTLSYEIVGKPKDGIITGTAPNLTYLPNPNFNGKDSLSFKTSDGSLESNVAAHNGGAILSRAGTLALTLVSMQNNYLC